LYKLEYLPAARQDMMDIVRYIGRELCNPTAAERLAMELIQAGDSILGFPYANPAYTPIRPLKHEYRKRLVQNYIMFYWVDEGKKLVTVARVVYAKRELERLLE
jgi:plasmid stabilization system protein ParE